jgi:putative heme-binding domain-containing protein
MVSESEESIEDAMNNKGVGPISSLELAALDNALVEEGRQVFDAKCTACHIMGKKHIGPDLTGVLSRRSPEWIMNMILNPDNMVKEDPIAKALLEEYNGSPMANQNLSEEEARSTLEYFRTKE